jgi:hypothetical protein
MAKCRRQNVEIAEQGKVWWNHRDIFDAEMIRRSLLVDRPRKENLSGSNRATDSKIS